MNFFDAVGTIMDVGDAIGLDNAAEACFDVMGDGAEVLGDGLGAVGGAVLENGDSLIVMGGIAALAGVAGYVIANHIASLDQAGKHLNKRLDEVPYQANGSVKECIGLFIGCRYPGQDGELAGCVNDLKQSIGMVQKLLGVRFRHLYIGVDDGTRERFFQIAEREFIQSFELFNPTKRNVELYYKRALVETGDETFLFLHYSGHGGSVRDRNGDESDGMDEVIFPTDHQRAGYILDDWLHDVINEQNPNVCMIACFDCCHSGTMLDLNGQENSRIIAFSGCQDDQTSADLSPADPSKGAYGAFTTSFARAILAVREDDRNPLDVDLDELESGINDEIRDIRCSQRSLVTKSNYNLRSLGQVMYRPYQQPSSYQSLPSSQHTYTPYDPQNQSQQSYGGGYSQPSSNVSSGYGGYNSTKPSAQYPSSQPTGGYGASAAYGNNAAPAPTYNASQSTGSVLCNKNHVMKRMSRLPRGYKSVFCDQCQRKHIHRQKFFYHCDQCEFDICQNCGAQRQLASSPAPPPQGYGRGMSQPARPPPQQQQPQPQGYGRGYPPQQPQQPPPQAYGRGYNAPPVQHHPPPSQAYQGYNQQQPPPPQAYGGYNQQPPSGYQGYGAPNAAPAPYGRGYPPSAPAPQQPYGQAQPAPGYSGYGQAQPYQGYGAQPAQQQYQGYGGYRR